MHKHLIVLPGGRELSSGGTGAAILQLKLTRSVNKEEVLTLGSACAAMLEVTFMGVEPEQIGYGQELWLYRVSSTGQRTAVGCFLAEEPVRRGQLLELTAYDRMVKLDRDMSSWLAGLDHWPYTLQSFAGMVCQACGLTLVEQELPNGSFPVQRFSGEGITGRQLLQWVGEAAGRFCRATAQGQVEFAWYTPAQYLSLGPCQAGLYLTQYQAGALTLPEPAQGTWENRDLVLAGVDARWADGAVTLLGPSRQFYYQGTLKLETYTVTPPQRLCIRGDEEDVGTAYPPDAQPENSWYITANPLLTAQSAQSLAGVAQTLYEQLRSVTYTPGKVSLPGDTPLEPGQTVCITDSLGREVTLYVMTLTQSGTRTTAECTGPADRESATQLSNRSLQTLGSRVLRLKADVDGLRLENTDQAEKLTLVEADLQGIRGQVSTQSAQLENVQTQMTQVSQTAQSLQITVENIRSEGAGKIKTGMGYTFDDAGLQIAREGQHMKNLLDNTGMYVTRGGQTVLQASDTGVVATDVQVHNYLVVGEHARFEDYSDGADGQRTACFWVQEAQWQ